ncbi:MAG: hypothetical protein IT260_23200, partial [Saprospiraceae bacterium]|nr:hypothetical protein [Saprospiraceae bacterium]
MLSQNNITDDFNVLRNRLRKRHCVTLIAEDGETATQFLDKFLNDLQANGFNGKAGYSWCMASLQPGNDPLMDLAEGLAQRGIFFEKHVRPDFYQQLYSLFQERQDGIIQVYKQSDYAKQFNLLIVVKKLPEANILEATQREYVRFFQTLFQTILNQSVSVYLLFAFSKKAQPILESWEEKKLLSFPSDFFDGSFMLHQVLTQRELEDMFHELSNKVGIQPDPKLVKEALDEAYFAPGQVEVIKNYVSKMRSGWKGDDSQKIKVGEQAAPSRPVVIQTKTETPPPPPPPVKEAPSSANDGILAQKIYETLGTRYQSSVCERLFKVLVFDHFVRGEDTSAKTIQTLMQFSDLPLRDILAVARPFLEQGILHANHPDPTETTTLSLNGKQLVITWPLLRKWMNEERELIVFLRELSKDLAATSNEPRRLLTAEQIENINDRIESNFLTLYWAKQYQVDLPLIQRTLSEDTHSAAAATEPPPPASMLDTHYTPEPPPVETRYTPEPPPVETHYTPEPPPVETHYTPEPPPVETHYTPEPPPP